MIQVDFDRLSTFLCPHLLYYQSVRHFSDGFLHRFQSDKGIQLLHTFGHIHFLWWIVRYIFRLYCCKLFQRSVIRQSVCLTTDCFIKQRYDGASITKIFAFGRNHLFYFSGQQSLGIRCQMILSLINLLLEYLN